MVAVSTPKQALASSLFKIAFSSDAQRRQRLSVEKVERFGVMPKGHLCGDVVGILASVQGMGNLFIGEVVVAVSPILPMNRPLIYAQMKTALRTMRSMFPGDAFCPLLLSFM
jgi:hypothetical protein